MKKSLFWILLALALCIDAVLAFLLIFVWKMEFYYGLTIAIILFAAFIAANFIPRIRNRVRFLRESLIVLAAIVNYTCAFLVTIIFNFELVVLLLFVAILSFFASTLFLNVTRSIILVCLSLVAGAAITVVLVVLPPLSYGEMWAVNSALEPAIHRMGRLLPFALVLSFIGAIFGSFAVDAF